MAQRLNDVPGRVLRGLTVLFISSLHVLPMQWDLNEKDDGVCANSKACISPQKSFVKGYRKQCNDICDESEWSCEKYQAQHTFW